MASWLKFFFATPSKAEDIAREIIKRAGYQGVLTSSPSLCDLGRIRSPELGEWMNLEGIVLYDEPGYALLEKIWSTLHHQGLCDHSLLTQFYIVEMPKKPVSEESTGYYQFKPGA